MRARGLHRGRCYVQPPFMLFCPQLIAIMWVYGVDNFMDDVKSMLGGYPTGYYYWRFVWTYLTPASVFVSINPSQPVLKGLRYLDVSKALSQDETNASQLFATEYPSLHLHRLLAVVVQQLPVPSVGGHPGLVHLLLLHRRRPRPRHLAHTRQERPH